MITKSSKGNRCINSKKPWHSVDFPLLAAMLLSLAVPQLVHAALISVTTTSETPVVGECTLSEAITAANTDAAVGDCPAGSGVDTIVVPGGTYDLTAALPEVESDITISGAFDDGDPVVINQTGADRIFSLDDPDVDLVLKWLTLTGGNPAGNGGAIFNGGGNLVLEWTTVSGNTALDGGGIFNGGFGRTTVSASTLSGNIATGDGGGIYNAAGAVTVNDGSTLSENEASNGGGIATVSSTAVNVANSTLSKNTASNSGGGIWIDSNASVAVTGSTFSENTATNSGGGIRNDVATVSIAESTFSDNEAAFGGGLRNGNSGTVTIVKTIFSANEATDSGGGIRNASSGSVVIGQSTFKDNTATLDGGGISNVGGGAVPTTLVVNNTSIYQNVAGNIGGGLHNTARFSLINTTLGTGNEAVGGGGIYTDNGEESSLLNVTIADNTATDVGGGIFNASATPIQLKNTVIGDNSATTADPDCSGDFTSLGYNLIETVTGTGCVITGLATDKLDELPDLGVFMDDGTAGNGGFKPNATSMLIDMADNNSCPAKDQRGENRNDGDADSTVTCDIGAIEGPAGALAIIDNIQPRGGKFNIFRDENRTDDFISISVFLQKEASELFLQPFDADVSVNFELVKSTGEQVAVFAVPETVPADTVPATSGGNPKQKYRFTPSFGQSTPLGVIKEIQFDVPQSTRVYMYVLVGNNKKFAFPKAIKDNAESFTAFNMTVHVGPSTWTVENVPLEQVFNNAAKVTLALEP